MAVTREEMLGSYKRPSFWQTLSLVDWLWALIVWLNYAAWLHMRLTRGWNGAPMAWWAVIGLFVTLFAFLGVNMFLSGLHSYGEL